MEDYNSPKVTLDDIVFEYRNKAYGAYVLRKIYDDTVLKALGLSVLLFGLAVGGPKIYNALKPEEVIVEEKVVPIELKKIEQPPPLDPKIPPPPKIEMPSAPKPSVSTVRFVPPEVSHDEEVTEKDPPKQDELKNVQTSTTTEVGDPNADPNEVIDVPTHGDGDGVIAAPAAEEVFTVVEQQPAFPGGMEEMMRFMSKNTKYPSAAQRAEVQGKVYVQFVVGSDGTIRDVQVVRGLGFGCDEEAIRVVKSMPNWNPGKQGGRAVSVKYTLPFNFTFKQ
ncbi:protein TonB [Flexibacter flexilis DSM 6793]|uniref:Protein TonB n=1 Tax=Flexibacter flexilis DSM 6793 TaxID=927664 RepID=A0A1I1F4K2_9BACT|nr:energy transducer TonB [Flexibacter flexilis]SFB94201.1 protein TonB [Flexibacter flexilis DSM 6793]